MLATLRRATLGLTALLPFALSAAVPNKADFIQHTARTHTLPESYIEGLLAQARVNQQVLDAIARPWEAKPWHQYYPIFLTDKRRDKGVAFWQQHQGTLERAEATYGVPPQIIVAILGVETYYGTYKGKYPVLDALYSLAFHYPKRAKFFASELGHYMKLTQEQGFDATAVKGSYAGAMGWGQFISSSYRHYAVDFDGDSRVDILTNPQDAIGSVANYFHRHGWQAGEGVAYPATLRQSPPEALIYSDLKPKTEFAALKEAGVSIVPDLPLSQRVKLQPLARDSAATEYWVTLPNFYTITRYNHSPLYAMAVYQLSEQIRVSMEQQ